MSMDIADAIKPEFYRLYTKVIQLYDIYDPDNKPHYYRYCANSSDLSVLITSPNTYATYTALAIRRSSITSEEGTTVNELEIGLDNVDLAFRTAVASGFLINKKCTVWVGFYNPTTTKIYGRVKIFEGYLDEPKGDERWVTMTIRPFPMFDREYPKRIFQVGCNWIFGAATGNNPGCTKNRSSYSITSYVASGSDLEEIHIADSGLGNDYFVPGYLEVLDGPYIGLRRPIATNTTTVITLRVALEFVLSEGTLIRLQKLCDKSLEACNTIFNNKNEHGGFPGVPKSPRL